MLIVDRLSFKSLKFARKYNSNSFEATELTNSCHISFRNHGNAFVRQNKSSAPARAFLSFRFNRSLNRLLCLESLMEKQMKRSKTIFPLDEQIFTSKATEKKFPTQSHIMRRAWKTNKTSIYILMYSHFIWTGSLLIFSPLARWRRKQNSQRRYLDYKYLVIDIWDRVFLC